MSSSRDLYENNAPTLFSQLCEVATGQFEPSIPKGKALSVGQICDNPMRSRIITCKDPERDTFVKEVGGLNLDLSLPSVSVNLPSYIPILDKRAATFSYYAVPKGIETIGLTILDTITKGVTFKAGTWHEQENIEFRLSLLLGNAVKGKQTILFPSGPDTLIEWIWYKRNDCQLFKNLRAMGFKLTSEINFSVMKGECSFAQALNQKRSLYSAYLATQAGIPAVPHIYAIDTYDIEMWSQHLKDNPQITLATMNCQLQKSEADVSAVVSTVSQLMERFPYLHFILVGFNLPDIEKFGVYLSRIHFADKVPVKYAQSHRKISLDLDTMKMSDSHSNETPAEIMAHNINQRRIYTELTKQRVLERYKIPTEIVELIKSTFFVNRVAHSEPI